MRALGSAAWELSVGAEQGRRARGLVIYRLAALLWCSDAVGRLHVNEAACQERCRRTALRRACDNTWRSRAEMRARGSAAWELSVGAEQGRRARGLVIYRLAALLWCSDAVGRLHVNEAACQERCGRIAAGRGGGAGSGAGSGAGTQSSWPGHIYIGWQRCCGAVGRSVARERGSLSRAMQAHCFAARV